MRRFLFGVLLFLWMGSMTIGCSNDPSANYQPLNLIDYGYPVTIMAPDSPAVKKSSLVVKDDITIRKDDYFVQIFVGDASIYQPDKVKQELIQALQNDNPYFSKVVQNDDHGFIYELKVDSTHTSYAFNYVQILGDKEYIFQNGLVGQFTEEQIRRMYQAVQPERN